MEDGWVINGCYKTTNAFVYFVFIFPVYIVCIIVVCFSCINGKQFSKNFIIAHCMSYCFFFLILQIHSLSVWCLKNIYAPALVPSLDVTTHGRTVWGKLRSKFVNQIANRRVYITTCMHEKFANVNGRGGGTLSFENRVRPKPTRWAGRACKNALCYVRISYELQRFRTRGYYRCNLNNIIIVAWWWRRFRNEWESCFFFTFQKLLAKTMCSYVVKGIHTAHTRCI